VVRPTSKICAALGGAAQSIDELSTRPQSSIDRNEQPQSSHFGQETFQKGNIWIIKTEHARDRCRSPGKHFVVERSEQRLADSRDNLPLPTGGYTIEKIDLSCFQGILGAYHEKPVFVDHLLN